MTSRAANFCIDAADPYAQTLWWAQVLGDYRIEPGDEPQPGDEEAGLTGPGNTYLLFLKVPEPKKVKNRMHFCLRSTDLTPISPVRRIVGMTATRSRELDCGGKRRFEMPAEALRRRG